MGRYSDYFKLEFPRSRTDYDSLLRRLKRFQPDIVHFSGHGTHKGILLLDDSKQAKELPTASILRLFRNLRDQVQLVILNGCYSSEQAKQLSRLGIYVVGNSNAAYDNAAIAFSKAFYISLSESKIVDFEEAFESAIGKVEFEFGYDNASIIDLWKDGEKKNLF
ncbi:MAG: CHAT domain-containing protein, partial [Bacteroidota bacterium]